MSEHQTLNLVAVFMTLLFVASLVAIVCQKIKFPFTILLVIIGLALGWGARAIPLLHPLLLFTLSPEVVLFVFLPVLIFESALNLNVRALIKNLPPILNPGYPWTAHLHSHGRDPDALCTCPALGDFSALRHLDLGHRPGSCHFSVQRNGRSQAAYPVGRRGESL